MKTVKAMKTVHVITTILNYKIKPQDYCRLRSNFSNSWLVFHQGFQTLENNQIHSTVHQVIFIVLLKLQNTQDNKKRSHIFIVFRVPQILENNKNRLENNLVKLIVQLRV